ncbi:hypothetical protein RKD27_009261 [Streptomyces sp. SAI-126]|uniref:hypothetical protein n=1 Tax=Streptomyces sp. SAI-126 TaxID=3377732 RepID=UPI003C7D5215
MEIAGWARNGSAPFDQPIDDRSPEVSDRSDTACVPLRRPGQPEADLVHLKSTLLTKESFEPGS